ncbi:Putative cytoplasmic protein [Polaromonas sp. CG9_12]|nr:Putative cytoplasmic protein [Polaromonas sp. CG9_12]
MRTNFEIGRHVVAHEQQGESRAEYGKEVPKRLAERLTAEFGSGFSLTNLKLMRQFYLLNAHRISQTASDLFDTSKSRIGQAASDLLAAPEQRPFSLSWSHYGFLLGIKKA